MEYNRQEQDERFRAWQHDQDEADAIERQQELDDVPDTLAGEAGGELFDWLANHDDEDGFGALAELIEAVAAMGAATGPDYKHVRSVVMQRASLLADLMIEMKRTEIDK